MTLASKAGACFDPELAGIIQTGKDGGKKKKRMKRSLLCSHYLESRVQPPAIRLRRREGWNCNARGARANSLGERKAKEFGLFS